MNETSQSKLGAGCLILFGAPFALVGVFSLWQAWLERDRASELSEEFLFPLLFGSVFAAVGFGIIWFGSYAGRRMREEAQLKQLHPDSPWMWKPEWASGRIRSSNRATAWFFWGFAVFWNLVSSPLLFILPDELAKDEEPLLWLALVFPLAGAFLLWRAVLETLRVRKFGPSTLVLDRIPGSIGGRVSGRIETSLKKPPPDGIDLALECVRITRSQSKNSSNTEKTLWQETEQLRPEAIGIGPQGLSVPLRFAIPADALPSSDEDTYSRIVWRLHASADMPGVDFSVQFELPVFRTGIVEEVAEEEAPRFGSYERERQPVRPSKLSFAVRPSPRGGVEYYFRPARHVGSAFGATVFCALWTGVLWLMVSYEVSWFFVGVLGLFNLLLFALVLDQWLGSFTIRIEDGQLRVAYRMLGLGRTREVAFADVKEARTMIGTATRGAGGSSRVYYDVEVERGDGKTFWAARHLRDKAEAEWLAWEIRRRCHVHQGPDGER